MNPNHRILRKLASEYADRFNLPEVEGRLVHYTIEITGARDEVGLSVFIWGDVDLVEATAKVAPRDEWKKGHSKSTLMATRLHPFSDLEVRINIHLMSEPEPTDPRARVINEFITAA